MPVKVLHITGNLRLGGAQVCVKYLVEHCDREKVKTWVYPLRGRPVEMGIAGEVVELPYRNYDPRKFWAILRLCREHEIDIIHAHLHKPILGSLLAKKYCDVPVVIHEHGSIFRGGIQYGLYRWLLRKWHSRAGLVIAVSEATADRLEASAGIERGRIRVIRNAVDLGEFKVNASAREAVRREWGVAEGDVVLGYVGRLDYVKGADLLVEAFGLLQKESGRYFLVVAGDGPQRRELAEQVRRLGAGERVRFVGFCEKPAREMQGFDIGVVPSRQEALGIAALELMRMKVPLVCSGVEGLAEIVTHEKTGLIPQENNPQG
ncbi:MAG: glycosyltransferase family 4 protein, partial [Planctomycetes bacterium]|nr:glycosyltransferase family 4 protein [Planctomycetota bacterium]